MSHIIVVVSVDWEGRSLLPENLQLMAAFRLKHPDVPMQHFLNPAYFTRSGIDPAVTAEAIRAVLLPEDDLGLHIHAWQSLLSAAGVQLHETPVLLKDDGRVIRAADDWEFYPSEPGYDAPLEHFNLEDLDKIVRTSVGILVKHGFPPPISFRAGAWMSGSNVQSVLAKNGFEVDCSAVDIAPVIRRFGEIPLCDWLRQLWPGISETSQPFQVSTPQGLLWQVPNNANLVDYMSAAETEAVFGRNATEWEEHSDRHCFVSTGFHQETARSFLNRLDEAIVAIKRLAVKRKLPLVFAARPQDYLARQKPTVCRQARCP